MFRIRIIVVVGCVRSAMCGCVGSIKSIWKTMMSGFGAVVCSRGSMQKYGTIYLHVKPFNLKPHCVQTDRVSDKKKTHVTWKNHAIALGTAFAFVICTRKLIKIYGIWMGSRSRVWSTLRNCSASICVCVCFGVSMMCVRVRVRAQ